MLNRRSPNKKKRTYVIGRRYLVEKKEWGGAEYRLPKIGSRSEQGNEKNYTDYVIAKQIGVTHNTVINASKFTEAVDRIVRVTGVRVNDILSGKVYPLQSYRIDL